tara:strand:- start:2975 stop:4069 length:1095 start_codon:yes stop_codon:yes gene_type:complete
MKDLDKSYKGFVAGEHGNAMMIALVVTAIFGAGFIGYKSGQEDIYNQFTAYLSDRGIIQASADDQAEDAGADNPVIAKVDGDAIRRKDVIALVNAMPPQMRQIPLQQLYPMALEQEISNKIVDKRAASAGLGGDKDVQKELRIAKQQIIRAKFLENEITARVDDARVKVEYEKYLKEFPDVQEVKAAHILVDDEKLAKDIIKKLDNGEDFAALAQEYSKDGSAENGGDLGYFAKSEVVPEFAEAAFSTKVGTYDKTPVKSDFGYHIVRVEEKRQRPPAEFDEIKSYLAQELQRTAFDEVMKEWKSTATIERFDIEGNPIPTKGDAAADSEDGQAQAQATPEGGNDAEPAAGVEDDAQTSDDTAE